MYENEMYSTILERTKKRISDDIQKGEGSLVHNALAAAVFEIEKLYIEMNYVLNQFYSGTADREYLIRLAEDRGVYLRAASQAVVKGQFDVDVPLGARFNLNAFNYRVTEKIAALTYKLICEESGGAPNGLLGEMTPITFVAGLNKATITEVLEEGVDEETTESLRERLHQKIRLPSTSGNIYDYYNWAMEYIGVGAARVFPLANGSGTVKVVIADSEIGAASPGLVSEVYNYIEDRRPIGATLDVESVAEKAIDIAVKVVLKREINIAEATKEFKQKVQDFLKTQVFNIDYISLARIGSVLLDVTGVEDYTSLTLNNKTESVGLQSNEIAVVGVIKLEVM